MPFFLEKNAGVAPMIRALQTHMQDDLASPHARRLSAGEDEIDRLLKIALRQTAHVRRVPVVNLSHAVRERLELWNLLRPRRLKRGRRSLQVMLKDPVDDVDVIEDA
jgi:hypothetical protein